MRSIMLFLLSLSALANADTSATAWIQGKLNNQKLTEFLGQTPDGRKCGLFLTDVTATPGRQDSLFYVVVGLKDAKDQNDYIGLTTSATAQVKSTATQLSFRADESWGNESKTNQVIVELNANGTPLMAIGVSDLKTISCDLSK